jgi:hypothetical protein
MHHLPNANVIMSIDFSQVIDIISMGAVTETSPPLPLPSSFVPLEASPKNEKE